MPGPDDFSVSIPVTGDIDPLLKQMDEATRTAQQKGQEAGQAYVQGVAMGAASGGVGGGFISSGGGGGVGGGVAGPGMGPAPAPAGVPFNPWLAAGGGGAGGGGGATPPPVTVPGGAGGGGGGFSNPFAPGGLADAEGLRLMMQTFEKFITIGERLGNSLLDNQKSNLELSQAMRQLSSSLSRQQDINTQTFSQQAGGIEGRQAGTFIDDEIRRLETENSNLAGADQKPYTVGQWGSIAAQKIAKYSGLGWLGNRMIANWNSSSDWFGSHMGFSLGRIDTEFQYDTPREVNQQQVDENMATLNRLYQSRSGLIRAGRSRTFGAAVGAADDAIGVESFANIANRGGTMDRETYHMVVDTIRTSGRANAELITKSLSFQGRQQIMREANVGGAR